MSSYLNRIILILGWIAAGMVIIDAIVNAPLGINITILTKIGLILLALCFTLLGLRRLLFNPEGKNGPPDKPQKRKGLLSFLRGDRTKT